MVSMTVWIGDYFKILILQASPPGHVYKIIILFASLTGHLPEF
jgi:hypothetical protein